MYVQGYNKIKFRELLHFHPTAIINDSIIKNWITVFGTLSGSKNMQNIGPDMQRYSILF